jgi:hypothetical protein
MQRTSFVACAGIFVLCVACRTRPLFERGRVAPETVARELGRSSKERWVTILEVASGSASEELALAVLQNGGIRYSGSRQSGMRSIHVPQSQVDAALALLSAEGTLMEFLIPLR